jgi:hypothetical protein
MTTKPTAGFHDWHAPSYIMDYPTLADDRVVIAYTIGDPWPAANRSYSLLTEEKDPLGQRWKWSASDRRAMTFNTKDQAYEWCVQNDCVIRQGDVMTIGELKERMGYPKGLWRRCEAGGHEFAEQESST